MLGANRRARNPGGGGKSSSELLQAHLPDSRVVKGFDNIYFGHLGSLQRPAGSLVSTAPEK